MLIVFGANALTDLIDLRLYGMMNICGELNRLQGFNCTDLLVLELEREYDSDV